MSPGGFWFKAAAWLGVAAVAGVGVWWACVVPYQPGRTYDAVPNGAVLVTRHLDAGARWGDVVRNPVAQSLLGTAGVPVRDALEAAEDEETRSWVTKLTGQETVLAYVPESNGRRDAWLGAAWLGGGAQRLRWQLEWFRPAGYRWMGRVLGCPKWEVEGADVGPGRRLVLAFAEGMLLAAVSADPMAVDSMVLALDRPSVRLRETDTSFRKFAGLDDREVPDVAWIRGESERLPGGGRPGWAAGGFAVELAEIGRAEMSGRAAMGTEWTGEDAFPAAGGKPSGGWEGLERILGAAPCAVAVASRATVDWFARTPGLLGDVRHSLRMVAEAAPDRVVLACLDGDLSGRISLGMMRSFGLRGIRVPTLIAATPVAGGAGDGLKRLQAVLDSCNARYRAAFVMRPAGVVSDIQMWSLESAGGDEWADQLALEDRPACAFFGDWLVVASNLDALRSLAAGKGTQTNDEERPAWAMMAESQTAPMWAWLDIGRAGKATLDALSMVSMVQRWVPGNDAAGRAATQELLNSVRAWVQSLLPFQELRASMEQLGDGVMVSAAAGK